MGMEVADVCGGQQPDCLVNYQTGDDTHDSQNKRSPGHNEVIEDGRIEGDTDPQIVSANVESKEYEVSECNTKNSVEIVDFFQDENCEKGQELDFVIKLSKLDADTPAEKGLEPETQNSNNLKQLRSAVKSELKSANVSNIQSNCTVPQPFALATEKRASSGTRSSGAEAPAGGINKTASVILMPSKVKKNQVNSRTPLQPDNTKHPGEEDSSSVASSTAASVRTLKVRTTVAHAPVFRCNERAAKRKEFYSKLEEKHQALEAERNQWETRAKAEYELAIKELRKSLTFRATPMPSFYHEGRPPKVELKKAPRTQAKSPKLGRRRSFSDAVNQYQSDNDRTHNQVNRYSTGSYEDNIGNAAFKDKVSSKSVGKNTTKSLSLKMTEQRNMDITVHS